MLLSTLRTPLFTSSRPSQLAPLAARTRLAPLRALRTINTMSKSLSGVALVTGGASGIGEATVRSFLSSGVTRITIADVQSERLEALKDALVANDAALEILTVVCDVSSEADVVAMVAATVEKWGRVDYAVNCAGILGPLKPTAMYEGSEWDRVQGINNRGVFFCVREQLRVMTAQEPLEASHELRKIRGSIVNIASSAGLVGVSTLPSYVSSKHGVVGLTKAVAIEYASKGIRCNAIAPGGVDTPALAAAGEESVKAFMAGGGKLADMKIQTAPTPQGRSGIPAEIADVAVFLSSEGASYVNGATWAVDGGFTAI